MLHLYAFDPGKLTGWAHLSIHDDGSLGLFRVGQFDHQQVGDMLKQIPPYKELQGSIHSAGPIPRELEIVFVCESFQPTYATKFQPYTLETTGLIRYWADASNIPLYFQTPSAAKSLIKDDTLRRAELWTPGNRHANDATIHAMYWLVKERDLMTEYLRAT